MLKCQDYEKPKNTTNIFYRSLRVCVCKQIEMIETKAVCESEQSLPLESSALEFPNGHELSLTTNSKKKHTKHRGVTESESKREAKKGKTIF